MPGIEQHHWAPYPPMVQAIESLASGLDRVLEIGPGHIPFGPATEFVDGRCRQASPAGLHLDFGDADSVLVDALNTSPMFWNTHFLWQGPLRFRLLQNG